MSDQPVRPISRVVGEATRSGQPARQKAAAITPLCGVCGEEKRGELESSGEARPPVG